MQDPSGRCHMIASLRPPACLHAQAHSTIAHCLLVPTQPQTRPPAHPPTRPPTHLVRLDARHDLLVGAQQAVLLPDACGTGAAQTTQAALNRRHLLAALARQQLFEPNNACITQCSAMQYKRYRD